MIIVNIKGGLGNQLFQYAAGRALLLRRNRRNGKEDELKIDIGGYEKQNLINTQRRYLLSKFNINAGIASIEEINRIKYPNGIISKIYSYIRRKIFRQFNIGFNNSIFNSTDPLYLDGFFQTEKYFNDAEIEIRKEITLRNPLSTESKMILVQINEHSNISISLHIRRGDYINDRKTNLHHGICSIEYYYNALKHITSKLGENVKVFMFSDDITWVQQNIVLKYPTIYVSVLGIPDYEELILMSSCKHNIISNSSFSWWGAWLNPNPNKIVISPKKWSLKNIRSRKDITPAKWIKI